MSTIRVTNLKHESSSSNNIVLDSSGNLAVQAGSASTPAIQATGDSNTGIYFSAADTVDVTTGGTRRFSLDSSGNLKFNSGYGSVATAYGCRAWVNFNGTSTVAIRASGNVSSITDNGTGDYTMNLTTAMPDANFAVAATTTENPGVTSDVTTCIDSAYTSSAIRVALRGAGSGYDATSVFLSVFR